LTTGSHCGIISTTTREEIRAMKRYTEAQVREAYEAYCAEMALCLGGVKEPPTFEELKQEQEAEDYWLCDAYLGQW
jgi:hypothetical protein